MKIKHFLFAILIGFVFITACSDEEQYDPRSDPNYKPKFDSVNNTYYQNLLIGKWEYVGRKRKWEGEITFEQYNSRRECIVDGDIQLCYDYIEFMYGGKLFHTQFMGLPIQKNYGASKDMLMLLSDSNFQSRPWYSLRLQNWNQNDTLLLDIFYFAYGAWYNYDTINYYSAMVFKRVE